MNMEKILCNKVERKGKKVENMKKEKILS